jgi:predicted TIM-barrel fold metal-dependent hydrolase
VGSQSMAEFLKFPNALTAKDVIALLDTAGIKKGVLLSIAYAYGRPGREPQNEYEKVKEENDWVAAQAAMYPKRLVAFCGFNPLKDYALAELERCAKNPNTRRGIKLHFGNSDVQLENPEHIKKLQAVFRAANANRMSIVVHMRASISLDRPYGAEQARAFLEQLLPLASNITVQIAHLGGSGPGFNDPKADAFMDALIERLSATDDAKIQNPKSKIQNGKNLWFDVASAAHPSNSPEMSARLAQRIRQIGVKRILYGTDTALGGNLPPAGSWAEFKKLDLTKKELDTIAKNRAPYLR